jgi:diguanylate cyclase (GGDEF)-like protein/PAS domain S-box-containing protein
VVLIKNLLSYKNRNNLAKEKNLLMSLPLRLFHNEAVSISTIYAIFGILWILLSDRLLDYILRDMEEYKNFQTYKGWFYILITTLMVYLLIRNKMLLLRSEIHKTARAYKELSLTHNEMVKIETELIEQKKLTDNIISEAPVIIVIHDEDKIISCNPYAKQLCGYTEDEINEAGWIELLIPKEYHSYVYKTLQDIRQEKLFINYEFPIVTKDGTRINILWNSNFLNRNQKENYFVSFGTNIDERKRYEEKVKQLAFYDTLTGLPNRAMFELEINNQINSNMLDSHFMIVYIDIDNFKNINDSMGHQVGDMFLTYLSECLKSEVLEPNIVARLGGDEFAILYLEITKEEMMGKIETIRKRINKTWSIENHHFYISMSVGVVTYPGDGMTSTTLLKNADIAMYTAKREGKNRVLFYEENINDYNSRHMKMINNLQYGIDEEQFLLYYQPQFKLDTGEIIGMEVLVRWIHPVEGFISPDEFIPLAEETGQIYKLERWIITKALEQKKVWEEAGYQDLIMSINLSGKTLTSSMNFEELEQIITNSSVDFDKVVIEITETASISDVEIVINHLNRLKKKGIKVALDDFGTGYSSLNYLKKFPINIIKLDKSFIDAINENGIDTLLIKNILTLAHDLQFEVVAEGIETKEQLAYLRDHFCESGQGYLLSIPIPLEKMNELLKNRYKYTD